MELLALVVALAAFALVAVIASRRTAAAGDVAAPLDQIAGAVRDVQLQSAVFAERLTAINDRLALLEGQQGALREGLQRLDAGLAQTTTVATGLRDATAVIREEIARAREGLSALEAGARARHRLEEETAGAIRRLEQVIAGTATKGAAGEGLLDLVFQRLPAEWQVRNFRVNNRVVEFGLRLPNGLVLPIDSKWPATHLLEQFLASDDPAERQRLKAQVEAEVLARAREVARYLEPELTANFAVAVVPDAVYDLCGAVQADCVRHSVVVGHSMFVPYLLLVFQTVLRASRDLDLEKLAAQLQVAEGCLAQLQDEVEGRLSRAIVTLGNSRDDLRASAARATSALAAVQVYAALDGAGPDAGRLPPQLPGDDAE